MNIDSMNMTTGRHQLLCSGPATTPTHNLNPAKATGLAGCGRLCEPHPRESTPWIALRHGWHPSHSRFQHSSSSIIESWFVLCCELRSQMLATLAADPIAGLVDTAYMGRLGGVAISWECCFKSERSSRRGKSVGTACPLVY
jgi:hypothetical protein